MKPSDLRVDIRGFLKETNLSELSPVPLINNDDSDLIFTTASISAIKPVLVRGDIFKESFVIQPCFRHHRLNCGLFSFSMLGIFSTLDKNEVALNAFFSLFEFLGFDITNLFVVMKYGRDDLISIVSQFILESNIVYQRKNSEYYSIDWTFGSESGLYGSGLTLAYKHNQRCSCQVKHCDILLGCTKYYPIGNIIIVKSKKHESCYIDIGIGIESVLAAIEGKNYYKLFPMKQLIDNFTRQGLDYTNAMELSRALLGIEKLLTQGVSISNNKHGYVLKRIARDILNIILSWQINLNNKVRLSEFVYVVSSILNANQSLTNNHVSKYLEEECLRYEKNISTNIRRIWDVDNNNIRQEYLTKDLNSTFGINKIIIDGLIEGKLDYA